MLIFRQKSTVRKRFSPLKLNSDIFNTSNPLGFFLVEGRMKKTLHCCFHPGNNTRFFLNRLCRWLSDLLGHLLATISSVQVSELLGKGKACTVKSFHGGCSTTTVYLMLSCWLLLQTPFYHTDAGTPQGAAWWHLTWCVRLGGLCVHGNDPLSGSRIRSIAGFLENPCISCLATLEGKERNRKLISLCYETQSFY